MASTRSYKKPTSPLRDSFKANISEKDFRSKYAQSNTNASLATQRLNLSDFSHRLGSKLQLKSVKIFVILLAISPLVLALAMFSSALPYSLTGILANLARSAQLGPTDTAAPTVAPSASPTPPSAIDGPFSSVRGPLGSYDFPDPAIIYDNGTMYAFATNNKGFSQYGIVHIQVASSNDNQTWQLLEGHDALPNVGEWQTGGGVWAPDVVKMVSSSSVED